MIIGFFLLVLFFATDYLERVNGWYLLFGVIFTSIGVSLAWKGRTPPEPSQRFRTVRKLMGKGPEDSKEDQEEPNK
ncbi:MAG TPA: hypothetical protein DCY42_03760 [Chloroflexi bacterium]|nr:hypothetical protein [Chloroflexota bacterium]